MIRRHASLLALLIFLVFAYHAWFFSMGIQTQGDWSFYFKETMSSLRASYFSLWLSDYSFGRVLLDVGQAPTYALYGYFAKFLGIAYAVSERFIHLWPSVILPVVGSYALVYDLFKSRRAAIAGALVYSCNTYIISLQTGHITLAVAYGLFPFIFLFFRRALNTYESLYVVLTALTLSICGAYEPRASYIVIAVLFLYTLYRMIRMRQNSQDIIGIARVGLRASLPVLLYVLMSLYWILGLSFVQGALNDSILSRSLFGNHFFTLPQAFTLFQPYWNFGKPIPFVVNPIPAYFWLIPLIAFAGLYFNRNNSKVLFFGILALIGVLLSKQADAPFRGLYEWLFIHAPGFSAFREASKFYFIVALAYSVLIAAFAERAAKYLENKKKIAYVGLTPLLVVAALFLPNLLPVITGSIGTTFAKRNVPGDYAILKDFILKQPDFFRLYWVPNESRWAPNTAMHPRISGVNIIESDWKALAQNYDPSAVDTRVDEIMSPFMKSYSDSLFDKASVKYVVVPIRDIGNDDDFFVHYGHDREEYINRLDKVKFLRRINIGTRDLAIYENAGFNSYVSAATQISKIESIENLESTHEFQNQELNNSMLNVSLDNTPVGIAQNKINDVFNMISTANLRNSSIEKKVLFNKKTKSLIYVDRSRNNLRYSVNGNDLYLTSTPKGELLVDGKSVYVDRSEPLSKSKTLEPDTLYTLEIGKKTLSVEREDKAIHQLGNINEQITLYGVDKRNLLANPSFEVGTWQDTVDDCNRFDNKPALKMTVTRQEHSDSERALEMTSRNHTACTEQSVKVEPGTDYYFSFDFKIKYGRKASYELRFNDSKKTSFETDIKNENEQWNSERRMVHVPTGATSMQLVIKALPDDRNRTIPATYYDNFKLLAAKSKDTLRERAEDGYDIIDIGYTQGNVVYRNAGYGYKNILPNGSFESGLWQKKVGDCNAYDTRPALKMRLDSKEKTEGSQSLEISSSRHNACTGPRQVTVKSGATYLLSFDHQSPNANMAGYNVSFNDKDNTNVGQRIKAKDKGWHNYRTLFKAPVGSNSLNLLVYSYEGEDGARSINRYDNFNLIEVPDLRGAFYSVNTSGETLKSPKHISFRQSAPSKRDVDVLGADGPFYLTMSEKYHTQWALELLGSKGFRGNFPSSQKQTSPGVTHFEMNDFMNAWYVDPERLCTSDIKACKKNADGTYDLKMVAEFTPQRWLNAGLVISALTLVSCLTYILVKLRHRFVMNRKHVWKHPRSKRNRRTS